jgi:hypothetical protein
VEFKLFFGDEPELFEKRSAQQAPLGGIQSQLHPGCCVGAESSWRSGNLGCILTDGKDDFALTFSHVVMRQNELTRYLEGTGNFIDKNNITILHPSVADATIDRTIIKEGVKVLESKRDGGDATRPRRQIQTLIDELTGLAAGPIGCGTLRGLSFGEPPTSDTRCRKLDYAVVKL